MKMTEMSLLDGYNNSIDIQLLRIHAYTIAILADNILYYEKQLDYKNMVDHLSIEELEQLINEKEQIITESNKWSKIFRQLICLIRNTTIQRELQSSTQILLPLNTVT